jgi:response regulator RpfG family c-di-GMP phosphodiesterase
MSEAPAKPATAAHAPPEASVVLVVDDSPDVLALAARVLGKKYNVRLAADDPKPDLILLDVEMEGASGFEVCRVLKQDPATAGIPLVFLSAKTEPNDQLEGFELGAEITGKHEDPLLKLARLLALSHHERWDSSGYPQGLKGEEIPGPGRVMAIADTFESMTTTQFYRRNGGARP